jgi:hypothetical protein
VEERNEAVGYAKKPYEAPVLEEREDLLQVTEGLLLSAVSESLRAKPM